MKRWHLGVGIAAVTALLTLGVLAIGVLSRGGAEPVRTRGVAAIPDAEFVLADFCRSKKLRCLELDHDVTAVVHPTSQEHRKGLLLWDAGGPGGVPLDAGATRATLPGWTRAYDIVTLTEPWVSTPLDADCLLDLRIDGGSRMPRCPWSRLVLDVAEYREVLDSLEAEVAPLAGVLTESFGAVRALPAIERVVGRGGFAVVASPSPWPDEGGARILGQRLAAARNALIATTPCPSGGCGSRQQTLQRLLAGEVPGVSREQAELAVLGMAANLEDNARFLAELWADGGQVTRAGAASLRRVAARFALSTGAGTPLPAHVGYLAGVCSTYSGWTGSTGAFAAMHRWCDQVPRAGYGFGSRLAPPSATGRVYLALNRADPVVPWVFQSRWRRLAPAARVRVFETTGHVSPPEAVQADLAAWVRSAG